MNYSISRSDAYRICEAFKWDFGKVVDFCNQENILPYYTIVQAKSHALIDLEMTVDEYEAKVCKDGEKSSYMTYQETKSLCTERRKCCYYLLKNSNGVKEEIQKKADIMFITIESFKKYAFEYTTQNLKMDKSEAYKHFNLQQKTVKPPLKGRLEAMKIIDQSRTVQEMMIQLEETGISLDDANSTINSYVSLQNISEQERLQLGEILKTKIKTGEKYLDYVKENGRAPKRFTKQMQLKRKNEEIKAKNIEIISKMLDEYITGNYDNYDSFLKARNMQNSKFEELFNKYPEIVLKYQKPLELKRKEEGKYYATVANEMLFSVMAGIRQGHKRVREFDIIDYYENYSISPAYLLSHSNLDNRQALVFKNFFRKYEMTEYQSTTLDIEKNSKKVMVIGRKKKEIPQEIKEDVVDYVKELGIPPRYQVLAYHCGVKRHLDGTLNKIKEEQKVLRKK